MPRDYKHRAKSRKNTAGADGLPWFAAGLAAGLLVALAVFVYDRRAGGAADAAHARRPVPAQVAARDAGPAGGDESAEEPGSRFDFYDMLPKFEVVIPEAEQSLKPNARAEPLSPGAYELQAGSFRNFADADHMKATLALQGIESRIQKVTIDNDQTWHRVRIGPVSDPTELASLRERLRDARIDVLVIRLPR